MCILIHDCYIPQILYGFVFNKKNDKISQNQSKSVLSLIS